MGLQSPSVMFIEMAKDRIPQQIEWLVKSEIKEFNSLGPTRKQEIIASVPGNDPMTAGYILGLETARALLAGLPDAVRAEITI